MYSIEGHTGDDSSEWETIFKAVSAYKNEDFDPRSTANATTGTVAAVTSAQTQIVKTKQPTNFSVPYNKREVWSMTFTVEPLRSPALRNLGQWKSNLLIFFEDEIPKGIRCVTSRALMGVQFRDRVREFRRQKRVEVGSELLELLDFSLTDGMDGKVWKCKPTLPVVLADKPRSLDD